MKLISRVLSAIIIVGTLLALSMPAQAGAYLYAGKRKKVYCGIVEIVNPLTGVVQNDQAIKDAALLFAKLDALNSMKPSGWTLENPLALSQNKADPYYWRIRVASARNLSRVNVLYLPGSGTLNLTDDERENLRRFVDAGGVLWVDNANPNSPLKFNASGPFFISKLNFKTGGSGVDVPVSRHHPLLATPYWLTDSEIMSLGLLVGGGGIGRSYCDLDISWTNDEPTTFDILFPIIDGADNSGALSGQPAVVANSYGSGRVVASANAVGRGCMLNEPYSLASLKFAFNIMSYASTWTDLRKNPRHSGSSIDTLGANRLVEKWSIPVTSHGIRREAAPLLYKNTVFYTSGDTLCALEQNGDTKGGMWPAGSNGEVIIWSWQDPDGGVLSTPTIATVQDPNDDCRPIEAVIVQNNQGNVFLLNAFPIDANNVVLMPNEPFYVMETAPTSGGGSKGRWPSPPIYINGWIYALGGDGRLYAENPCLKKWSDGHAGVNNVSSDWQCPDLKLQPGWTAEPRCGPSFGTMRNANTGAVLGMVYWFTSPTTMPMIAGDINDHICSLPVSVSRERPKLTNIQPGRDAAEIRVTYPGWLSNVHVSIFEANGITPVPLTEDPKPNQNIAGATQPGTIALRIRPPLPRQYVVYCSYSISYGNRAPALNPRGGEIEPKSASTTGGGSTPLSHGPTEIAGTPVMGPDNQLFLTGTRESSYPAGGSILAYANDGGVATNGKLKWHYFLHSGVDPSFGVNVDLPGVIQTPKGPMINPQPSSSPAFSDGKVFVTVSGSEDGPRGALLCLRSSAECVVRITEGGGYDSNGKPIRRPKSLWKGNNEGHYNVRIWQPNLINDASSGIPLMDARDISSGDVSTTGISVDYDTGTITFDDFSKTKIQKMMVDTNTFSPSLPVWVYLDNVEVPIDWTTWGPGALDMSNARTASSDAVDLSGWNNLLWYYVVDDHNCSGIHSPPTVIGNTVYFTCDDGYLYALDTESGESRGRLTSKKPIWTTKVGSGQMSQDSALSVAGANGVLMVPGPDGLYAYTDTTTLVTDNNRITEIDGQGEVTWAVDSIDWPANVPQSTGKAMALKQGPINKPSRARYVGTGEILFCNSGANQVCKIDKSGRVGFDGTGGRYLRWIYTKFADPKKLLRPGQPTQLSGPRDAIMWQEMESVASGGVASVVHCLIADSGNSRILDLTYRVKNGQFVDSAGEAIDPARNPAHQRFIDPESGFVLPELNWASKTDSLNERYAFDCLQLVSVPGTNSMVQDIWVASSNFTSSGTDMGGVSPKGKAGLGGAIMAIGYRHRTMTAGQAAGEWDYSDPQSGTITARCDRVQINGAVVPLANPRFFDVLVTPPSTPGGSPALALLICDNYGVYEAKIGGPEPVVGPRLLAEDYSKLLRLPDPATKINSACPNYPPTPTMPIPLPATIPFIPTSVQKLPNGKWLITNSYSGSDSSGAVKFSGEAFEYDPEGPIAQEVTWCSPRLEWVDPPPSADPCAVPFEWKQVTTNTYNLRQPKSAFRQ